MANVVLDGSGNIIGMFANPQDDTTVIADTDARVVAFASDAATQLAAMQSPSITFLQFMALFTPAEQAALVTSTDTQTRLFVMMATGSGGIQLGNAEVIQGVNYIASIGIITTARATQILAGQPPSS